MAKTKMVRCADCAYYPWAPGADPDLLPAQRCHPALPWQRWTTATRDMKRECSYFKPAKSGSSRAARKPEPKPEAEREAAKGSEAEGGEVTADDADAGAAGEAAPAD